MKFDEIKEKLESVESCSQYVRVSSTHPLELYLGKNEKGYMTLRYNERQFHSYKGNRHKFN